ncbi:sarcosine oxidase subunit delta [Limimonas halophila]|uniref:Sarcosine oxidase subunit delta n=1 Tax=Limimonas halophila TaxID=1082479 RepID=A0A1G7PVN0_9PROT|nr:sarcosine oxidase subunit delta [Limimonas halophila]SDF89430.1 sarcosine oxidase subunit delta [Limimonas halophila]
MLLIPCPYCGERSENEFGYGGEAHKVRPENPEQLSDADWNDYVFLQKNTKGTYYERWVHSHGCRRWFNVARDTLTNEVLAVYPMGEQPPEVEQRKYI